MRIKLEIQLDLPDEYSEFSKNELRQLIFDEYINYNNISHLKDSLFFMSRIEDDDMRQYIINRHNKWAKICDNVIWDIIDVRKD